MKQVILLDYGCGNVRSVYETLIRMGLEPLISNKASDLEKASHIILPGVGAYKESMNRVKDLLPLVTLEKLVHQSKIPFLGICVGMQLLSDFGEEFERSEGLGWIPGKVSRLSSEQVSVPHIGWNQIQACNAHTITQQFDEQRDLYFVHSFHFEPKAEENIASTTEYGQSFVSAIQSENIVGVQFHPEKSQTAGQMILENFLNMDAH